MKTKTKTKQNIDTDFLMLQGRSNSYYNQMSYFILLLHTLPSYFIYSICAMKSIIVTEVFHYITGQIYQISISLGDIGNCQTREASLTSSYLKLLINKINNKVIDNRREYKNE